MDNEIRGAFVPDNEISDLSNELEDVFYKTYKKIKYKYNKRTIDKQINYYLYNDNNSYKTRLDNIIKKII